MKNVQTRAMKEMRDQDLRALASVMVFPVAWALALALDALGWTL